jgi:hypothetical protein
MSTGTRSTCAEYGQALEAWRFLLCAEETLCSASLRRSSSRVSACIMSAVGSLRPSIAYTWRTPKTRISPTPFHVSIFVCPGFGHGGNEIYYNRHHDLTVVKTTKTISAFTRGLRLDHVGQGHECCHNCLNSSSRGGTQPRDVGDWGSKHREQKTTL